MTPSYFTVLTETDQFQTARDCVTSTGVLLLDPDMKTKEAIVSMGTLWGSAKLATLDGYYTELSDEGNLLSLMPTQDEPEPSTLLASLAKGGLTYRMTSSTKPNYNEKAERNS